MGRTLVRPVAAVAALVAVLVTAVGWLQSPDALTGDEAVVAAKEAFAAAGLDDAVVRPRPEPGDYSTGDDGPQVPVWKTFAELDEGTVELWLAKSDGESVFLDDRTPDGSSQLLSDAQFEQLADHYENPALGRQVRRNIVLTLAAALLALVGVTLAREPLALLPAGRPDRSRPVQEAP